MDHLLSAKYCSHRRPAFRIVTEIREGDERKYVVKRAGEKVAEEHIREIHKNQALLRDIYTDIHVIPAKDEGNRLVFPFIQGTSLKDKLLNSSPDRESFIQHAEELLDVVLSVREERLQVFAMTDSFRNVFGDIDSKEMMSGKAICPANIDSTFDNFLENEEGIFCIDYEWVFDFPVPAAFIRYRTLCYLYYGLLNTLFAGVSVAEYMKWFGIEGEKLKAFEAMEYKFQQYVHGKGNKYQYLNHYFKQVTDPQYEIARLSSELRVRETEYSKLQREYDEISNSIFWKMTFPIRKPAKKLKKAVKGNVHTYRFFRFFRDSLRRGPRKAAALWKNDIEQQRKIRAITKEPDENELRRQKKEKFPRNVKFSILVPLYNTPAQYLMDMIESVEKQTYENWELCMADGSDEKHAYVGEVCRKYQGEDSRICYCKMENGGISENTNACLRMATGDYIALFDHDDYLHPSALYENMRAICAENADFIYTDERTFRKTIMDAEVPHFKPDYSPDTLRSYNYICHFVVFSRELLEKEGGMFRKAFDGSQDYDIVLRLTEKAGHIVHIPKALYYWRIHDDSTSADVGSKLHIINAAKVAVEEHLKRVGLEGKVLDSRLPSTYKIQYAIKGNPLISILIPNKDHMEDLDKCLNSIKSKSTWKNWEAVIIENNSTEAKTFDYYKEIEKDPQIRVVKCDREFNFSAINNFGAQFARGEYLLLLNNDIEVITPDWLEQMLMFAQREDVGAVGAMLYYPDGKIQHAGVIVGLGGVAGHSHKNANRGDVGYAGRLTLAQNLSAVTGACMMIPRKVWDQVGGLDETFAVAFNDIDVCLRIRREGYLIVWTPYAELYHYESKSRGYDETNPEKKIRLDKEKALFGERWRKELDAGDPYYNPNLTLDREDFSLM